MVLSNFAKNLMGPWMIHPEQVSVMMPILNGILRGNLETEMDSPAPYRVSCSSFSHGDTIKAGSFTDKSIYVTYLTGTMLKHNSCGAPGTRTIGNELLQADQDPEIIGHIIIADSGGGAANSVKELSDAIQKLTKPVVTWVDGIAASACIYAISYTDKILAHQPMDQIGCIGTMIELSGYAKYSRNNDGYVHARVYADGSEEKNLGYEAALEGNATVIKEERLNPLNEQFIADIKSNRPNVTEDQLKGRTYYAKDVVGTLIDGIGSLEDAMNAVIELAQERDIVNSSNMNDLYPTLVVIPGMEGLVCAEDGTATLQACQLEAIEAELANRGNNDDTVAGMQSQIDDLNQQVSDRDSQIETLNNRVAELQASLDAALEANADPDSKEVDPKRDPAGVETEEIKTATNFAEAKAACEEFLKNF